MLIALAILILSALLVLGVGVSPRYRRWSGYIAMGGVALALLAHLTVEVFATGVVPGVVPWPPALARLGEPVYKTDPLSTGLGTWCLLVGFVYAWLRSSEYKITAKEPPGSMWKLFVGMVVIAILYSLVH